MLGKSFKYDVIVCTFNGSSFIREQLVSILNQRFLPHSVVLADDGSSDNTIVLAEEVFELFGFTNFLILRNEGLGACNNFLFALNYSNSDFVFFSDQDDIWHESKVSSFQKLMISDEPQLVFSDSLLVDANGNSLNTTLFQHQVLTEKVLDDGSILFKNCVQGATMCINTQLKDLILDSMKQTESRNYYMHDWWIALIASSCGSVTFIDQPLIMYRQHSNNQIGAGGGKKLSELLKNLQLHYKNLNKQKLQFLEFKKWLTINSLHIHNNQLRSYKYVHLMKKLAVLLFLRINLFFVK